MSMLRSAFMTSALLSNAFAFSAAAQEDKSPPKELVQYVRDAQKAGLKPTQILLNATQAGWSELAVSDALGAVTETPKAQPMPTTAAKDPAEAPKEPAVAVNRAPAPPTENPAPKPTAPAAESVGGPKPLLDGTPTAPASAPPENLARDKTPAEGARGDDYLIGEGDVLQISVWGERDVSVPSTTVRTDGKISMPLIKEVQVAGLTPSQVEKYVQEQLGKIIRTPDVTVIVVQINSKKIYLTGAVKREGPLKFTYRMTVLQAISEAGGLTDYSKRKEVYVLHNENGRQYKLPFNYNAVLKGEHMEQNILLSPGDTIVVP